MASKYLVILCHLNHPDWSAPQIAKKLGCSSDYVRIVAKRNGLELAPSERRMREPLVRLGRACRDAGIGLQDIKRMAEKQ